MDQSYYTTQSHIKGHHLSYEERMTIQIRLKDGWSARRIAKEIGCAPNTVCNEIKRGTVSLYHGHVQRYKAAAGQEVYMTNRQHSCRNKDYLEKQDFIQFVETQFFREDWSLDACVGSALKSGLFTRDQIVCTRTLYTYVDLGLIGIANHNLPEKLRRKTKSSHTKKNKRILGRSIEERDESIQSRDEFGHWECDLVLGSKTKDDQAILSMLERKSRNFFMIPIAGKSADAVMDAFTNLRQMYAEHWDQVFKTITTDNGSEFASLSSLEEISGTKVYYCHPYTSCEKGSVERHNGIIRRFMPKGKRMDSYTADEIGRIELWCNGLPRKILNYRTPEEVFDEEMDQIYRLTA